MFSPGGYTPLVSGGNDGHTTAFLARSGVGRNRGKDKGPTMQKECHGETEELTETLEFTRHISVHN